MTQTNEQRENCQTLATYLAYAEKPPEVRFDMTKFASDMGDETAHYCGSSGCAVGFGPFAGIKKVAWESWVTYANKFTKDPREFDWCFSALWEYTDNTPEGAAKRIQRMLDIGVPVSFNTDTLDDIISATEFPEDNPGIDPKELNQRVLNLYKDVEVKR